MPLGASGKYKTDGAGNNYAGSGAGLALTPSVTNAVLLGTGAGASLDAGTGDVFIGYNAGQNVVGVINDYNVVIGAYAGQAASVPASFKNNVLVGHSAGAGGTPVGSVIIGASAGTGFAGLVNSAVIIGNGAAAEAEDPSFSIIIGQGCTPSSTTGKRNIIIGYLGGFSLTTGSDNVLIGTGVDVSDPTETDILRITNATMGAVGLIEGRFTPEQQQLWFNGALNLRRRETAVNYEALDDCFIACTASNIEISIFNQAFPDGRVWIVKDESGTASPTSPIYLYGDGLVDGQEYGMIVEPYGVARLYNNGVDLFSF